MSQCAECRTDRDIEVAAAIGELRAEVRGLRGDIKDGLISQLKDHGKRIGALERETVTKAEFDKLEMRVLVLEGKNKFRAGWVVGIGAAGATGGAVGAILIKVAVLFLK